MKSPFTPANPRQLHRTARAVLQQYAMTDVSLQLVGDVHNDVFRVTVRSSSAEPPRQFALRLHLQDWHTKQEVESELIWLEAIRRDTSLVVPFPIRNEAGDLVTHSPEGTRLCTLFHWVPGRIFWKRPSSDWLCEVGRLMAQLQNHGASFKPPAGFHRSRWDAETMTGRTGKLVESWDRLPKQAVEVFTTVCDQFFDAVEVIGTDSNSFGLIHGDLHVANVVSQNEPLPRSTSMIVATGITWPIL